MSDDSVKEKIEASMKLKYVDVDEKRFEKSYREHLLKDAIKEIKERKVSAVCLFIFLILNVVAVAIFPSGVPRYPVYFASAFLIISSLFRKTLFDTSGIYVLFFAGFYAFIFYNSDKNDFALAAFLFWASAVFFTVRLKRIYSILLLLANEAFFVWLIYLLLK